MKLINAIVRYFIFTAGLLLVITSIAKIVSACGGSRIMITPEPLSGLSYKIFFWIVGLMELTIGIICLLSKESCLQISLIAWLSINFLLYRIGLTWFNQQRVCSCLGNLTDALHIKPETADTAMKFLLAYLLIGSYGLLFWLWWQRKKAAALV
jgi:hypothetical protein